MFDDWSLTEKLDGVLDDVITHGIAVLLLIVVAVALRWALHRLIDRMVKRTYDGRSFSSRIVDKINAPSPRRAQRAKTLGDLIKSIVTGFVVAIFATMILSELGVNVAPILASAGIVGLAIGFGAQSLVKDYVTGMFMIVEDQYGVGDVVDLGEAIGTVEQVTLRITRVRALDGTVWYVPNGEILRVGNQSQNWARAVVDVGVAYDEDLVRVKSVLKDVAHDMWQDEDYKDVIIEEPEVTGVEALAADAITLRILVKTAPLEQWAVAREMRQRIKARFDYEGIEIPFAQRVVWHRDEVDDDQKRKVDEGAPADAG